MTARLLSIVVLGLALAGCVVVEERRRTERRPEKPRPAAPRDEPPPRPSVEHRPPPPSVEVVDIPRGHLPPRGRCRVWFPGRPPGHQPPPGDCDELAASLPAGAWLLARDGNAERAVRVR